MSFRCLFDSSAESIRICLPLSFSFVIETTKRVQQLTAVLQGLTVHLEWVAPRLFISDVDGYNISYM